ncbi:MAG: hypothetical protein IPJ33_20910 [Gammaproteobacteria bacterium]|jgi:hypothetical protein|nr:hypothetical protein [Gammaproteobacteria bacterium]MBP6053511.1 hypothetical protein [Pseudomonadales bacterium]MBK6584620.1 hypothetical protein [Gammaproteobacteria bacterium]MBK7170922.1 hypothetical protein [Gammaproteobacteria bacterium]MBK7519871.1 hypothetical protein [Gammaproteobacteria bacterium]
MARNIGYQVPYIKPSRQELLATRASATYHRLSPVAVAAIEPAAVLDVFWMVALQVHKNF